MIERFVNSTYGNNLYDGTSRDNPWATIPYAASQSTPGMKLKIAPGNYTGVTTISVSGNPGPTIEYDEDTWISFEKDSFYTGDVNIDGTGPGNRSVFAVYGKSFIKFSGLNITNRGQVNAGAVCGFEIGNLDPFIAGGGSRAGSSFITVEDCSFSNIDRDPNFASCFGAPFNIFSQGNVWLGGTSTNHIVIRNCRFNDSMLSTPTIGHAHITLSGNVEDFLIEGNTFTTTRLGLIATPLTWQTGIEFGGNQLPGSFPNLPRKGVIIDNFFNGIVFNGSYAIYPTAVHDILIKDNYIKGTSFGVGLVAERGADPRYTTERVLVIDNNFEDLEYYSLVAGAFQQVEDNYNNINNIWAVNNSTLRTIVSTLATILLVANSTPGAVYGTLGITGDSKITRNITSAEDSLLSSNLPSASANLLTYNMWASNSATPFIWNGGAATKFPYAVNQDINGFYQNRNQQITNELCVVSDSTAADLGGDLVPTWYHKGLFGDYEPVDLDITAQEISSNQLVLGRKIGTCVLI